MSRSRNFISNDKIVKAVTKRCNRDEVAIDSDAVGAVIKNYIDLLFDKATHEDREDGDSYSNRLFRITVKDKKERMHRNPRTGEAVARGATRIVKWTTSAELKEAMESKFRKPPSKGLRKLEIEKNGGKADDDKDEKKDKGKKDKGKKDKKKDKGKKVDDE